MIVFKEPHKKNHPEEQHARVLREYRDTIRAADRAMFLHKKYPQGYALFEAFRYGYLVDAYLDIPDNKRNADVIAERALLLMVSAHPELKEPPTKKKGA